MYPNPDINADTFSIITNLFHVQPRNWGSYVGMGTWLKANAVIAIPLMQSIFNDRMIFNMIPGAKINIIFIGHEIVSWCIDSIRNDIAIPPGKCGFPGLYPTHIFDAAWFV